MPQTHVTNGSGVTPESVTNERVVTPKRDRAAYMRNYRAQRAANNHSQEFSDQINPEAELTADAPQPKLELNKSDEPIPEKPTAEEYHQEKIIPEANEATLRLKQQLAELERSAELNRQAEELNRRQQAQVDQVKQQINQVFHFWKQSGLTAEQEQALRGNPALMIQLTEFAATEAAKVHQVGSAEYIETGKKLFFQHLDHLQEQARQHAMTPTTDHQHEPTMQPKFFEPISAPAQPRPQRRASASFVSAPVSRNGGPSGDYGPGLPTDPSKVHLSAAEVEAARVSGISATEYARQKLRMLEAKSRGEIV